MRKTKKRMVAGLAAVSILAVGNTSTIQAETTGYGFVYDDASVDEESASSGMGSGQEEIEADATDGETGKDEIESTAPDEEVGQEGTGSESNSEQGYELIGIKGDNDWYMSNVTIHGLDGNKICGMAYGIFRSSITIEESGTVEFFLLHALTGSIRKVSLGQVKIDTSAPKITGVEDGMEYKDTMLTVQITDDNLAGVTVNGIKHTITDSIVTLELEREFEDTPYTIVAVDEAGMETICTFTMKAIERLERGKQYVLETGIAYFLGDGTWRLINDTITYNGNTIFYVDEDGIYEFIDK